MLAVVVFLIVEQKAKGENMTASQIIEKVEAIERQRHTPVQRFTLLGSDGKEYGASMPWGVTFVKQASEYWVFQTRQGTTVGKRYASQQEALDANEEFAKRHGREMAAALADMSEEQIKSQSEYWEKQ